MWVFEVEGVGGVEDGYCFGVAIICIVLDPQSLLLYRSRIRAVVMESLLTHDGSFVKMAKDYRTADRAEWNNSSKWDWQPGGYLRIYRHDDADALVSRSRCPRITGQDGGFSRRAHTRRFADESLEVVGRRRTVAVL